MCLSVRQHGNMNRTNEQKGGKLEQFLLACDHPSRRNFGEAQGYERSAGNTHERRVLACAFIYAPVPTPHILHKGSEPAPGCVSELHGVNVAGHTEMSVSIL